ncbi:shematrin-like protein 2 [Uloborus diversus]|uniref:shematrin-like protein 2 n=1 Tax=Uloborus diversus TaxID=327109 RepID=UPI00240A00C8|nr:shematrin-like protein 2 [Uloborus diversus]XP_054713565.1 shematrin-like protein 2 [Uloborus diversus]
MMKLVVLAILLTAAAASVVPLISSQRAVIPHYSPYGFGHGKGISSRYFDKVEGYGLGAKLLSYPYYGAGYGLAYGGLGYGLDGYGGYGYGGPLYF